MTVRMVRDWRKNEDNVRNMIKEMSEMRRGSTRWLHLEDHVAVWTSAMRQDGYIATQIKIRACALKWANPHEIKDIRAIQSGLVVYE